MVKVTLRIKLGLLPTYTNVNPTYPPKGAYSDRIFVKSLLAGCKVFLGCS